MHPALTAFLGAGEATSYADLTLWAAVIGNDGLMRLFWARAPSNQVALALYLPCISPLSPLHLPYISPISRLGVLLPIEPRERRTHEHVQRQARLAG